jgi:hypothetical protein
MKLPACLTNTHEKSRSKERLFRETGKLKQFRRKQTR